MIGLDSHCLVTANFGAKPFAFDVPAFESWFTGTKPNCYAPSAPEERDEVSLPLVFLEYRDPTMSIDHSISI